MPKQLKKPAKFEDTVGRIARDITILTQSSNPETQKQAARIINDTLEDLIEMNRQDLSPTLMTIIRTKKIQIRPGLAAKLGIDQEASS